MSRKVNRTLPGSRLVDGSVDSEGNRGSGYGEEYVVSLPDRRVFVEEGSYRVALNPTPGTGVAGHAAPTSLDNTKPFVIFRNGAEVGGKNVELDYIKLVVTAAGTAGTLNYASHQVDDGAGYTSGGSALTPTNPNSGQPVSTVVDNLYAGAAVATAGGNARTVAHQRVRTVIPVVGDVILFRFGGDPVPNAAILAGTAELERVIQVPSIIVAPGHWYKLILWRASQSAAASYEVEMGWIER